MFLISRFSAPLSLFHSGKRGQSSLCKGFQPFLLLFALIYAGLAHAQAKVFEVPKAGAVDIPFDLRWSGGRTYVEIEERRNNGGWSQIRSISSASGSISLTQSTAGTYSYRLRDCSATGSQRGFHHTCVYWTDIQTITISKPPNVPTSLAGTINPANGAVAVTWGKRLVLSLIMRCSSS